MTDISKEILDKWQIRKTKKQKTDFISFLETKLGKDNVHVETGKSFGSRNIIIGNTDISNVDYVVCAHYDTQPVLPFPNFLAPKNMIAYILYMTILTLVMLGISIGSSIAVIKLGGTIQLANLAYYAVLFIFVGIMMFGPANKHTANDNTSGVITVLDAYQDSTIRDSGKVAFVLFDHEEVGLIGSSNYASMHKKEIKNQVVINIDCIGDGSAIMFILSKHLEKEKDKANMIREALRNISAKDTTKEILVESAKSTFYPSDQLNFKKNIALAAFNKNKIFGYYLDKVHTSKDTVCDYKNIEIAIHGIKNLIN